MWKEFDTKVLDNFRKMLENAALEIGAGFEAFCYVYGTGEYFLTVRMICNRLRI